MIFTIRSLTLTAQMINTDAMYSSKHMCQFEFQVGKQIELTEKISAGTVYIKLPLSSIIRDIKEKEIKPLPEQCLSPHTLHCKKVVHHHHPKCP